jgi:hypothetical protein
VLLLAVIARLLYSLPLDQTYPPGTDTFGHLFRAWYASEAGAGGWSFYHWGGFPFLRYFSPLGYLLHIPLSSVLGWLVAYKLVIDMFFVATPIAAYFLFCTLGMEKYHSSVSALIFSLFPLYLYHLYDGRYPSLISFFFCLLFWAFIARTSGTRDWRNILLSSLSLALAILTHSLMAAYVVAIVFVWVAVQETKKLPTLMLAAAFAALFSSWFIGPYFYETTLLQGPQHTSIAYLFGQRVLLESGTVLSPLPTLHIGQYGTELVNYITFFVAALVGAISLLSLKKMDRKKLSLWAVIFVIVGLSLLMNYKRILVFLPLPLLVLSFGELKLLKRTVLRHLLLFILVAICAIGFFSMSYKHSEAEIPPTVPNDGRVMYLPLDSPQSILLYPLQGTETVFGWWVPGEIGLDKYRYFPVDNLSYTELIFNSSLDGKTRYALLSAGWINYVVVEESLEKEVAYFSSSPLFSEIPTKEGFRMFELVPKSSYIDVNGKGVETNLTKGQNIIHADFACSPGTVLIKENYHPFWHMSLNGRSVDAFPADWGFTQLVSEESGRCMLEMKFTEPSWYCVFKLLWLLPLIGIILLVYYENQINKGG